MNEKGSVDMIMLHDVCTFCDGVLKGKYISPLVSLINVKVSQISHLLLSQDLASASFRACLFNVIEFQGILRHCIFWKWLKMKNHKLISKNDHL